jgi:hypothetical protein
MGKGGNGRAVALEIRVERLTNALAKYKEGGISLSKAATQNKVHSSLGTYAEKQGWMKKDGEGKKAPWVLLIPDGDFIQKAAEEWPKYCNGSKGHAKNKKVLKHKKASPKFKGAPMKPLTVEQVMTQRQTIYRNIVKDIERCEQRYKQAAAKILEKIALRLH